MKTLCLHNRAGQVPDRRDLVNYKVEGEGDCWNCTYNAEENKNCRKFFPITITTYLIYYPPRKEES